MNIYNDFGTFTAGTHNTNGDYSRKNFALYQKDFSK